jgi:Xaa-Pro aminopeptidase
MLDRQRSIGELCRATDVRGVLVFGNDAARHHIRFLTGWPPGWDTYALAWPSERTALWVPSENHVPSARAVASDSVDVEWIGADPIATLPSAIRRRIGRAPVAARLGVVGPIPHTAHAQLAARLGGVELIDISAEFVRGRLVKSAEEIDRTRAAAALADAAIEALRRAMRPGVRDFELGAAVENAYRRLGGEHGICFLASAPMSGGGRLVPAQVWSGRTLLDGDMVMIELSVGVGGSTSQVLRTIALGTPTPVVRQLHDVADAAFAALLSEARPGASAARLLEVAGLIDRASCTVVDDVVHGYGGGYLPPVLRTPATQRRPPPDMTLRSGMMLVIQPNVVARDGSLGLQTGELVVVTDDTADRFHAVPTGLLDAS